VREFPVRVPVPVRQVIEHCQDNGVNPGYALGRDYPEHGDALLIAVTERRTRVHLDLLVDLVAEAVNGPGDRRPAA
jgi:glycine dehydrogenase subunit 1